MEPKGQHEAGNESHVVIEREPAIEFVVTAQPQHIPEVFQLGEHARMSQRDALLKTCGARGVLNERELAGVADALVRAQIDRFGTRCGCAAYDLCPRDLNVI